MSFGAAQEATRIANAARTNCRAIVSMLFLPSLPTIKSEELLCSCRGCASNFFHRNSAGFRNFFGDKASVCGFATFSAKRHRRQVRAIGFDHETVERNLGGDLANLFSVFEGNDSGERNDSS